MDKRTYLRHFGMVLSGTAIGQAINLLSYPVIARLYLPADFGVFALFLSVCAVPGIVSCWRFELAIPTAKRGAHRAAYWMCLALSASSGVLAGVAAGLFSALSPSGWAWVFSTLVGLAVFLTGFCAASTMYLLRKDGYRTTSAGIATRTAIGVLTQIALAYWWRDPIGLIAGYCAGFVAQALVLGIAVLRGKLPRLPTMRQVGLVFRRYRKQVSIDVPSTLLGSLSINLMAPLLIALFGPSAAGIYALAFRVAVVPMQVFNDALSQVFFQKAARAQEARGGFWPEYRFSLLSAASIALAVIAAIYLFAGPFVGLYLGARWAQSADVLTILAPMIGLGSVCMSVATAVFLLKRVHWLLFLNIATVCAQLAAFTAARVLHLDLERFLTVSAALMGSAYLIFILCLIVAVRRNEAVHRRHPVSVRDLESAATPQIGA